MSLPSGYTQLEYIQSTGTQYIDTGFKPNQDTRVVCDFDMVKNLNSKDAYIFGARIASGNTSFGFANLHNQTPWYATYANEAGNYDTGSNTGRHTVDMSKNNLIVDGTSIHTFTYETFQSSFNLHLFAVNTNGTVDTAQIGVVNLYSCQIYDNGTLVRNFIPAKTSSGTIGLYDDVNNKFYTDMAGGNFTALESTSNLPIGNIAVGNSVCVNIGGKLTELLILHHGKPSNWEYLDTNYEYDESCDGTWVITKDIYELLPWDEYGNNEYAYSTIHEYLNNEFLNLFQSDIQEKIKEIQLPYAIGGGSEFVYDGYMGISTKVFLLDAGETGIISEDSYLPISGSCLDYFNNTNNRIAYYNDIATSWWIRSPYGIDNTTTGYYFTIEGTIERTSVSTTSGIRPAFVLPSKLLVNSDTFELTSEIDLTLDPVGDHNILADDGTVYEIESGQVMVDDGTVYEIESGQVMADDGTVYEIVLGGPVTITITGSGNTAYCCLTINGTKYTSATTLELDSGTTISCYVAYVYGYNGYVYLNGETVAYTYSNSTTCPYAYTPTKNATIALKYSSGPGANSYATITITEE